MRRATRCGVLAAVVLLLAGVARADLPPPVTEPFVSPFGPYGNCYQDVEIFNSLKYGDFDFCRLRLQYRPGRAECLRILISTCNLVAPGARRLGTPGGLDGFGERIICPPGPPPPTCPSGYWD